MSELPLNSAVLIFDEFLGHLRRQGFTIDIAHYLRLQQLLNHLNGECAPAELKMLLCPLFAINRVQQEKFYSAFDLYFRQLQAVPVTSSKATASGDQPEELTEEKAPTLLMQPKRARLIYPLGGGLAVVVALALVVFLAILPPAR